MEEKGRKFIRCNFKQIVKESTELKDISIEELELILQDDELNVRYEELIFEAIKFWIETKIDERKKYVPRLLNCVRFGFMSSKFFNDEVLNWKIFHNDKVTYLLYLKYKKRNIFYLLIIFFIIKGL